MSNRDDLTDEQWRLLEPLIPEQPYRADGKGRPRQSDRSILNGIIFNKHLGSLLFLRLVYLLKIYQCQGI
jgi:transposase